MRGTGIKKLKEMLVVPLTWPAGAGHPLPSGEEFTKKQFAFWTAVVIDRPYSNRNLLVSQVSSCLPIVGDEGAVIESGT